MNDFYPSRIAPEAQMLPRLDPVVHGKWTEDAPLTRQQAEEFDRDGFLVLENVFSPEEVAYLQQQSKILLSGPEGLNPQTVITEPGSAEIRSIFEIHLQSRVIGRLAADARLAGVAQFLLDDMVYIHQSRLNYKPGFEGKEFYWHSDFETWHVEDGMPRMRALSMSVLLAENTPDNGPLMLMPGSHRVFLTCIGATPEDHYRTSLKKQEFGVPDRRSLTELAHRHDIVAATGGPGTVVIFDCNTMHGSNSNITPYPRANAFFVYNAVSNRLREPFGVKKPRPGFIAARGETKPLVPQSSPLMEDALT
ncbi:putative L-proline 4-hydroxylase [Nitrobacter sp. Nb-311A]|uniref:ectoine hydroxylase n=1 Tax=unclassified Nitrobacter TaxID=2620411 RepID=UPI0000687FF5|nr:MULTISPECIES: ectoine hydroxylase [unclassified Nitrobacter]EAQ36216.1 putative L-proline 4-hydroxylase [Nitrobacter sp. Nb-311A]MCB1392398.1 ectoine hydroxylase [Nitrobacter sp.]MCV0387707.1 ectoine hydroxylase [Nitrobacter sp.]